MNKQEFKKRLIEYCELEGLSRYEENVAKTLVKNINSKNFKVSYDNFGSVILHKESKIKNAPKFMVAAHMDEVGYLVRQIHENGQLLLSPVGGIWPSVAIGTKATLITSDNKRFCGLFGHTSVHIMEAEARTKALTNKEIYADFGFKDKEEAISKNVQIGDRVLMSGETIIFDNENLAGAKAMDNRAGVTTLEYIAHKLSNLDLAVDLYLVGTAQEEVGTRGAKTSVSLIDPEIAIALDTTSTHDTIGTIAGTTALGKGAAIRVMDGAMMANPKLVELMCKIGRKEKIKHYKFVAMGGGTDASALQYARGGAATLTISLAQRYLHSPIGVCNIEDLMAAGDLIVETIKSMSPKLYESEIKYH
ncbi:M42 family peptidase [Mycoplasmopsis caviae]|uniref:Aminopeptidase ysdC n=1 Tax=Mycoplasmopsis caviae TaxID=55603 RepID=A0A3P8KXA6_9BACT|nr:M42 family peptidase [Mycoplasmopsis caviae]UUD34969.1 M42 family peptidase [Mycoplasmopsis caviae]VDR42207.1 Putative aminopeptidase ysdC [Mycoplasmopsis caviae]